MDVEAAQDAAPHGQRPEEDASAPEASPAPAPSDKMGREPGPVDPEWVEHQTRGLLNLIGLLSHCLRKDIGPEEERRQWRLEVEEARRRLDQLRRAG